ncbi:ATP-binding protein [Alteromonas facilis]|uniref:ATP-binding protein n=1 Tax=Alteromonas facilis TaxID=2048004 RepID=UPI000C29017A|nr:ATP-binding protein [Alteromonas facilis]
MHIDSDSLKHAYITSMLRALILLLIPLISIIVYFNFVSEFRPLGLIVLGLIFSFVLAIYLARAYLSPNALSLSLSALLMVAGWMNCYNNASIAHAGIAVLVSTFTIAVYTRTWVRWLFILLTNLGLYLSFNIALDFDYVMGADRWLIVTAVGQLIVLNGISYLFTKIEFMFEKEHQLRLESEASAKAKTRFLANMSHEIRTPIAGVSGLLDTFDQSNLNDNQRSKLSMAKQSATLLSQIVNDILDYAKIEAGKLTISPVNFELSEFFTHTTALLEQAFQQQGNQLILSIEQTEGIWIEGDKTRLQQVLINLLSNANKFTQQGAVSVMVSVRQLEDAYSLKCSVKDTGIGMTQEQIGQLFQPFHQLDHSSTKKAQGTGLGLLICKQILRLMNGSISVKSEEGQGSEFSFYVTLQKGMAPKRKATKNKPLDISGCKALIVEDNFINQTIVQEMLSQHNVTTDVVENGEEAIGYLSKAPQNSIDIILMDCQMPVMDGFEATQLIRSGKAGHHWQATPIVALTANALKGDKDQCLDAGMSDYLSKPIEIEQLVSTIAKYYSPVSNVE